MEVLPHYSSRTGYGKHSGKYDQLFTYFRYFRVAGSAGSVSFIPTPGARKLWRRRPLFEPVLKIFFTKPAISSLRDDYKSKPTPGARAPRR